MIWEEVKKYNEKNMLLNSEVNMLKKKIETLDEDILLKEGQITILKDTIGRNKSFDPPEVAKLAASSLMEVIWAAATRIELVAMFASPAMVTRAAGNESLRRLGGVD
ncbi:hypothetical protein ACFX2J_001193 [Malus domestica]